MSSESKGKVVGKRSFLTVKKVNDVSIKLPKSVANKNKLPVKGVEMFEEPYANIFLCARKKSGKSVVIFNILKKCVGRNTTVVFFCSTLYKDMVYKSMLEMLERNNINYVGYTSLKDGDTDNLQLLVEALGKEGEEEYNAEKTEACKDNSALSLLFDCGDVENAERKAPKPKYIAPEYIIILDDLSDELKSKSLVALLKKNRHYKTKIICSSQYYNDLLPESRKQIDYVLIFKNIPVAKLHEIYKDCNLSVDFEEFLKMYQFATKEDYGFLYVDCLKDKFRKKFNVEIGKT